MTTYPETNLLLMGVGGTLSVFSLAAIVAHAAVRDDRRRAAVANLVARVKSWWIMAALLAGAFLAGDKVIIALFAFVSFASLREFLTITHTVRTDRSVLQAAFYLLLPAQYWFIWKGWYWLFVLFVPVGVFLVLPVLAALAADTKHFLARISELQWGLTISVYCISYVPALLTFSQPGAIGCNQRGMLTPNSGASLAVFLIVVVESSDIMQYVFGKLLGRRRILQAISPSKTAEGLAGGLACATALGAALCWIVPLPFAWWLGPVIAFLIGLAGFLGGMVLSAIKRDRGVKDWGCMIPGHGGMLDRLDSLCFAAPVFFHLARWLLAA